MSENNSVNFTPFNDVEELNNQRKLKILSQTPSEMIVEISRVIEPSETEQTNAINATNLNSRFNEMKNSLNSALNEKTGSTIRVKDNQGIYQAKDIDFDSDPQTQITNEVSTRANFDNNLQSQITTNFTSISNINNSITNITNNATKLKNTQGGFAAGNNSQATAGGAVGSEAVSTNGGAVGSYTKTGNGFAGGYNARTTDSAGNGIDAIQLGAGTNNQTKTLQVYSDNIYDAASHTLYVNNANITTADITTLTNTTINNHGTINTTGLYTINGVRTGRNRTFIGTYTGGDGVTVPIGSLAAYSYFEIVFNGVSSRKISTGLISCADKTYFSVYYPNVGGIRGYKASDTSLRIEDTDGTTSFSVYGIN